MPLVIQDDYAQLSAEFRCEGDAEPMFSSIGVHLDIGILDFNATTVTRNALDVLQEGLSHLCTSDYTVGPGQINIGVTGGDNIHVDGLSTFTGDAAGSTPLPPNSALLIHKSTAFGGRKGRGRMYIPGTNSTAWHPNGTLYTADKEAFQEVVNDMAVALLAVDGIENLVLFHSGETPDPSVIIGLTVVSDLAHQDRRLG